MHRSNNLFESHRINDLLGFNSLNPLTKLGNSVTLHQSLYEFFPVNFRTETLINYTSEIKNAQSNR